MQVDYRMIGERIKGQRKRKGYTQEVLAEKLDVSVGYVSQVERGITRISLDLLAAIAGILECDMALLVTGSAVATESYMQDEFSSQIARLDQRERRMLAGFLKLMLENRT